MDQREVQRERQIVLNKVVNDFGTFVSRRGIRAGYFLRCQMHRLSALSIQSPNLINQLEDSRDFMKNWLFNNPSPCLGENTTLNRETLVSLLEYAIEFFSTNKEVE